MHIINFNTVISGTKTEYDITHSNFDSTTNLLDADIIFWNISSSTVPFTAKHVISEATKAVYENLLKKRKDEFNEFFELGRTLIIFGTEFPTITYTVHPTNHAYTFDFFDALETEKPNIEISSGKNISAIEDDRVGTFLNANNSIFSYKTKFINPIGHPLMYINGTGYVISQYFYARNGLIVFLPFISPASINAHEIFIRTTISLSSYLISLRKNQEIKIDKWAADYQFTNEIDESKKKEQIQIQIQKLEYKKIEHERRLEEYRDLKILFSGSGPELEHIVEKIFRDFGFQLEPTVPGRDDLIVNLNEKIAVIEIKGVSKSAGEKQAAQLEKWVSNYFLEKGTTAKGILIVNTFRNTPVEERIDDDFPNQMLVYSQNRNHCLITGLQLLTIYIDFKNGKIDQSKIVDLLFDTVGVLTYSNDINLYIKKKAEPVSLD